MSDESPNPQQAELAAIEAMNKAHRAQTSWLIGNDVTDRLREHEAEVEADNNNEEEQA